MGFKKPKYTCILITAVFLLAIPVLKVQAAPLPQDKGEGSGKKIALLPFTNFSKDKYALLSVMPEVKRQLEEQGLEVVDWDSLSSFVCEQRVRSTGYVSKDLALRIKNKFAVSAIFVGAVLSYLRSDDPQLGISARLIDSSNGSILWADYAAATGEDFVKILGLGKVDTIENLISKVTDRLFSSFTTEAPIREKESTYTIAVMPFQNNSTYKNSGQIAMYLFLTELFKTREFIPVEYGSIRKLIVDSRIMQKGELNYQNIKKLSDVIGTDIVLVGTVETYSDGLETGTPPKVVINARLLDTREKKILWFDSYELNGDDDIIVLDWGKLRSVDRVADKVVSVLLDNMKNSTWFSR